MNHHISSEDLTDYFNARAQGDYFDIIRYLGKLRGAVRMSIGIATTKRDIEKFIQFADSLIINRVIPK